MKVSESLPWLSNCVAPLPPSKGGLGGMESAGLPAREVNFQALVNQTMNYSAFQIDEPHRHNQNPVGANGHSPLQWSTEMKTAVRYFGLGFYLPHPSPAPRGVKCSPFPCREGGWGLGFTHNFSLDELIGTLHATSEREK